MRSVDLSFLFVAELPTGIRRLTIAARRKSVEETESTFCPISSFSVQSASKLVGNQESNRNGSMISKNDKPMESQLVRRVCFINANAINGTINARPDNASMFSAPVYSWSLTPTHWIVV